jgi:hypothetical protein
MSSSDWAPHVVGQGDTLTLLAYRAGVPAEDIWSHENNAALSAQRKDGDILFPSDVVYLPAPAQTNGVEVPAGSTSTFVSTPPTIKIRLHVEEYASSAYTASVGDPPLTGSVDPSGQLELEVPVTTSQVRLEFTSPPQVLILQIGCLDPADEISGLQHRLSNLGLPATSDEDGHAVRRALALFQDAKNLAPTGDLDPDTQAALAEDHGM